MGGAQRALRRGARHRLHGYDVDFCLQVRAGRAARSSPPTCAPIHHHALELVERPRRLGRGGTCASPRSGTGGCPASRRGRATGRQRARRAEAEREAARAAAVSKQLAARRPRARARATARGDDDDASAGGIDRAAAARSTRCRRAAALARPSARRISSFETTDCAGAMPSADPQPREPLGDRERARLEHPPQHAPPARARCARDELVELTWACARWRTRLASSRSSSGLRSHGSSTAAERVRPRRVERATRRRGRRTPARRPAAGRSRVGDEVLDRGEHAVARAALLRRRPRVRQAAGAQPRLAGEQAAARRRPGGGARPGSPGVVVVVAPAVRPATSWNSSSGSVAARAALGDQPQLLADREVVVVAVDDHRVGQRDLAAARRGSSRGSARVGRSSASADEAGCGAGSMAVTRAPCARRPVDEHAREVAGVGADLDHRARADSVQARQQQLGRVRQRGAPASRDRVEVGGLPSPGRDRRVVRGERRARRRTSSRSRSGGSASTGRMPV